MFGILNLFKPSGITSRDCVNAIQRLIRPLKVGHAGTLDPLADGVLLIAVGQAVRLIDWIHLLPKTYCGTFELGKTSPSADNQTEVSEIVGAAIPTRESIEGLLPEFLGSISQVPPIYSAVHIDGKRAYALARQGKAVEIPSRTVKVYRLSLIAYDYPKIVLDIECGTGTYVRSLGRDLARRLENDAIMTNLHRASIGRLESRHAIRLESLDSRDAIKSQLVNPLECLTMLPRVVLDENQIQQLYQGKRIAIDYDNDIANGLDLQSESEQSPSSVLPGDEMLVLDKSEALRSIVRRESDGLWRPYRNLVETSS